MVAATGTNGRFTAGIDLTLYDNVTASVKKIISIFPGLKQAGAAASKAFQIGANLKQTAEGVQSFGSDVSSALKAPIKTFMDFEASMSKVRAATFNGVMTPESKKQFEELSKTARQLGATTQFSASEAASGLEILATQGFDANAQIAAMPALLDLAAASTESIATATDVATATMNQFALKATDVTKISDVLIKTANSTSTGLVDIGEAMKYAGAEANKAGVPLEKASAMIGVLGNFGIKGSQAGTALRSIFSGLQAPTKQGKSALDFLGIKTKDKQGNLKPVEQLMAEMQTAMDKKFGEGKGGARRAALFKAIFGQEAKSAAAILAEQAKSGNLGKVIEGNMNAAGTAALVAKDVSNNALGASKELSSAYEELQLVIGETLIPRVVELFKWANETIGTITTWAKANPELVSTLGKIAGGLALTGIVLGPVLKGFTVISSLVGIATSAFGLFSGAIGIVSSGLKWLSVWAMANPVTAAIMGIALAATLIYTYWEPIKGFFSGLWDGVASAFKSAMEWILNKIEWAGEKIRNMKDFLSGNQTYTAEGARQGENLLASKSDAELQAMASSGLGGMADLAKSALEQRRRISATASSALSSLGALPSLMPKQESAANAAPASALPMGAPLMPELTSGAMPSLPAQQFDGKLQIEIRGADVAGTTMKTNAGAGFQVQVRTGTQ